MKIMQIVTQMEGGGAQRVAVNLNNEMNNMGLKSNLCFLYLKRPTYTHVPNTSVLMENKITNIFGFIKLLLNLIKFIISYKPDVLVTHTHYSNVLVQPIAWILGVRKRIAVQHNPVETYPRLAIILDKLLGNFKIYTKNVVVSKTVFDSFKNYSKGYKDKLVLIYNGIEIKEIDEKSNNKYDFNFPNNEPIILNVGRLSLQKNQKIIIEAMQYIDHGKLVIVGEGELRKELSEYAKKINVNEKILFLGEVAPEEVNNILNSAQLFVFPSIFEAMGLAVIEAMAQGLPVIALDIPAMHEMLIDSNGEIGGLIVYENSGKTFAEAINYLICNEEERKKLSEIAVRRAKTFGIGTMAKEYVNLFKSK